MICSGDQDIINKPSTNHQRHQIHVSATSAIIYMTYNVGAVDDGDVAENDDDSVGSNGGNDDDDNDDNGNWFKGGTS
jgi:hypothetical protein